MKLVILNAGADTAGCGIALKRAFDNHAPGWEARAISRHGTYLQYPTDIVWPKDPTLRQTAEVIELVRNADVVHVMDHQVIIRAFRNYIRGKVLVVHHLGTNFRRNPALVSDQCRRVGATQVTDSLDLMLYPRVSWLPVTTDLDAIAAMRLGWLNRKDRTRVRIAHAPTNRSIKSTDFIIETVEALAKRYPIDFDLIERVSNRECLERKSMADIFVDELTLGYGLNAIECWAMGIPVVSGLVDHRAREKALGMWGELPWEDATAATLASVIERLVVNKSYREAVGDRGQDHAYRWHSQRSVVQQTIALYERAGLRVAA